VMARLLLLLYIGVAAAFVPHLRVSSRVAPLRAAEDDPTKTPVGIIANAIQGAIQNSPIAEGKKLFVKLLAGNYDEAAARAELDRLISSQNVVMFSFPK